MIFFTSSIMIPKKRSERQQKIGRDVLPISLSFVFYIVFIIEDVGILYRVLTEGYYYDFAYEWYPVSVVRLPLCILGIILLTISIEKGKPNRANKWIICALVLLFMIQCIV